MLGAAERGVGAVTIGGVGETSRSAPAGAGQATGRAGGRRRTGLEIAATIGAVLAVFEAYLVVKWVLSPGFTPVHIGPTPVPTWIKAGAIGFQALFVLIATVMIVRLVILPWRRERRVGFDGLLCVASLLTSVYDASSAYFHNWFIYNSYLLNMGNPASALPGWQAHSAAGENIAWPIVFFPTLYAIVFVALSVLGCAVMGQAQRRWPRLPKAGLMAICYVTMVVVSIILEGQLFMRLGLYLETGWSIGALDSTYSHNPLRNILLFGVLFTGLSSLRFFRNDRGQTLVERGGERLGLSARKSTAMRFLGVLAGVQLIIGLGYHLPMALTTLAWPDAPWHSVMVQNSYLNDALCGVGTPRVCPGN